MIIQPRKLAGSFEIELLPIEDSRGYFMRTFCRDIFRRHGLQSEWVQENQSLSRAKHTIRGLHFQKPPHSETKLIRVLCGAILDVFVDLRLDSRTYGKWDSVALSEENGKMVYIPRGFAHGFCTLTDDSVVLYKVDNMYAPESEGNLRWNDPEIGIKWPTKDPILSEKDQKAPLFRDFVSPFPSMESLY